MASLSGDRTIFFNGEFFDDIVKATSGMPSVGLSCRKAKLSGCMQFGPVDFTRPSSGKKGFQGIVPGRLMGKVHIFPAVIPFEYELVETSCNDLHAVNPGAQPKDAQTKLIAKITNSIVRIIIKTETVIRFKL